MSLFEAVRGRGREKHLTQRDILAAPKRGGEERDVMPRFRNRDRYPLDDTVRNML